MSHHLIIIHKSFSSHIDADCGWCFRLYLYPLILLNLLDTNTCLCCATSDEEPATGRPSRLSDVSNVNVDDMLHLHLHLLEQEPEDEDDVIKQKEIMIAMLAQQDAIINSCNCEIASSQQAIDAAARQNQGVASSNVNVNDSDGIDSISKLPDAVLLVCFSFL